MQPGLRICRRERKVDAAILRLFAGLPVAVVSDNMNRMFAGGATLRPMHRAGRLLGPAFTVHTRPGDNLFVHKALDLAEPGDVIVVDAGGDLTNAIIGEIMTSYAAMRGIAGFVINGAIRDSDTIGTGSLPVYAAGVTHRGPYKDGPGEINVPVSVGGMTVEPGDLVIGDADGLLVVPFDQAETIGRAAVAKHAQEEKTLAAIARGEGGDRAWVDAALRRLGLSPDGT